MPRLTSATDAGRAQWQGAATSCGACRQANCNSQPTLVMPAHPVASANAGVSAGCTWHVRRNLVAACTPKRCRCRHSSPSSQAGRGACISRGGPYRLASAVDDQAAALLPSEGLAAQHVHLRPPAAVIKSTLPAASLLPLSFFVQFNNTLRCCATLPPASTLRCGHQAICMKDTGRRVQIGVPLLCPLCSIGVVHIIQHNWSSQVDAETNELAQGVDYSLFVCIRLTRVSRPGRTR